MALKIKATGGSSKPVKTTAKRGPGRPKGSKNKATTKTTARGSKVTRTRNAAKATPANGNGRRSSKTDLSQAELRRLLSPMEKAATKREALKEQWKEYVEAVNEAVYDAVDNGVPVHLIVDNAQITRQHFYSLMEKRGTASNGRRKSTTKKAAAAPAKRGPGRPKGSKNKTTATTKTKLRIKA